MIRIKRWFRKRYLFFRYKHNWKHRLIPVKPTDRGFGLSTLIMNDSLRTGIPILVPYERDRKYFAHEMYKLCMLGFAPYYNEKYIKDNLLISPSEKLREKKIPKIYVDNSCRARDVESVYKCLSCKIENGFVRED